MLLLDANKTNNTPVSAGVQNNTFTNKIDMSHTKTSPILTYFFFQGKTLFGWIHLTPSIPPKNSYKLGQKQCSQLHGTLVIESAEKTYGTSTYKTWPTTRFKLHSLQTAHMDLYLDIHTYVTLNLQLLVKCIA